MTRLLPSSPAYALTFGSLFSGIGGFDLGFERTGMQCAWQVEIDPYCQKVLQKHWPDVERYADVRECGKHNLKTVDLIVGGFPCQPHSVAGKRRGKEDDRDLWPEYHRIIGELNPTWVVGENVPGIRTTILDQVLSDLEDMDYSTRTLVIPACAFDAPHRRERVFVIAHTQRDGCVTDKGRGVVPDQDGNGESEVQEHIEQSGTIGNGDVTNTSATRLQVGNGSKAEGRTRTSTQFCDWWAVEPPVGRVVDGLPGRVDRLRALGNAVVPQVAEWLGQRIMEVA